MNHRVLHLLQSICYETGIFLVLAHPIVAQPVTGQDSTRHARVDSTALQDSLRIRFIPAIGSLRQQIDSTSPLYSSNLVRTDARYFGNVLWRLPGFFLRDLGEPGKPGEFNAWGTDWRDVAILMDGRPINDPITGTYNLYDIPMEFIDQVEEFSGAESSVESWNAPGAALNFVTHQYNTLRPITKVRYVQAPNNDLMTDGLFTQNLLRGLNFMFGFQRHVSDGKFNGSQQNQTASAPQGAIVDNWNVRSRIRYNASERLNFALTYFYNKDIDGLNGGIDTTRTPKGSFFDDVGALVNDPNGLETVSRSDVSLITAAKLFPDSLWITQVNAYYTHETRDYTNPGSAFVPLTIADHHYAELRGIRIQQSIHSEFQVTQAGVQTEHSQYASDGFFDSTTHGTPLNHGKRDITSGFIQTDFHPIALLSAKGSVRFDDDENESEPSFGLGLTLRPDPFVDLFGEYGRSYRFPTFQESSWTDSTIQRPSPVGKEQHTVMRAGLTLHLGGDGLLSVAAFHRTVADAIVFQSVQSRTGSPAVRIVNIPEIRTNGLSASLAGQLGPFGIDATFLYTDYAEEGAAVLRTPKFMASGELYYRNKFFKEALDAKLGIRFHAMSDQRGATFFPRYMIYAENSSGDVPAWSRLDAYTVLRIGDAYITLSLENLLNANYYITPVYPMPGMTFRLGVNWEFLD